MKQRTIYIFLFLMVSFIYSCKETKNEITTRPEDNEVYTNVEQMPVYPGGIETLVGYISSNVKYPEEAKKNGVEGKVLVQFTIEKTGEVSNINVIKGVGFGCDEEAIRVCKLMQKWQPGKKDGKPVRVKMILPFSFKLFNK